MITTMTYAKGGVSFPNARLPEAREKPSGPPTGAYQQATHPPAITGLTGNTPRGVERAEPMACITRMIFDPYGRQIQPVNTLPTHFQPMNICQPGFAPYRSEASIPSQIEPFAGRPPFDMQNAFQPPVTVTRWIEPLRTIGPGTRNEQRGAGSDERGDVARWAEPIRTIGPAAAPPHTYMHLANESVMPVNALTSQSFQSELQTSIVAAVTMCFSSVVRNAQIVSEDQCELIRRAALKFAYKAGLRGDDAVDCEFAFVLQTLAEMNEDPDLGKILFSTPARLYARARNFASNIAKHLRMQAAIETPFETPTEPEPKMRCLAEIDASELPETHAIKAERNERLHKALACLLPAHRMLVVGHVLGGESFVVIAAAVGKSTAAVRQEFHRVMLRLQRMLEDPEEDPN